MAEACARAEYTLTHTPLERLAPVTGREVGQLVDRLRAAGFEGAAAGESIHDFAEGGGQRDRALGVVFGLELIARPSVQNVTSAASYQRPPAVPPTDSVQLARALSCSAYQNWTFDESRHAPTTPTRAHGSPRRYVPCA